VLAKSTDDGKHWRELPTVVPPSTSPGQFTSGGDSDVAVGRDGTVYAGDLDGLLTAEVEFPDEASARAFVAPEWLGRDVTDDPRYGNRVLAVDGIPT